MDSLFKKIRKNATTIFIIADIFLVVVSSFLSFILRFDGIIPSDKVVNFYSFTFVALLSTIFVFFINNLYRISWKYISITDLPHIFTSVIASGLTIGAILFLFRDAPYVAGFPRSIVFIYILLLFLLVATLRFSKRIYWQIIKFETAPLKTDELLFPLTVQTAKEREVRNICITGGAGYIGSVLTKQLLEQGYQVKVLDKLLFGSDSLKDLKEFSNFQFINTDIFDRETVIKNISDADAVVNLAAIVGESASVAQKDVALQTNYLGAVYLARLCKAFGIRRFVQLSTCSTYGQNEDGGVLQERSKLFPVDFYGETKIYAERELQKLMDEHFNPTILRLSTIYGLSPRMRFDLVVNHFTRKAVTEKEIVVFGGSQWRPFMHVQDAARSIALVLQESLSKVGNQIFNVGNNTENYTIAQLGEIIKEQIPGVQVRNIDTVSDKRNYKISFDKIEKNLHFSTTKTVKDGIIEIRDAIISGQFGDLDHKKYYNHLV